MAAFTRCAATADSCANSNNSFVQGRMSLIGQRPHAVAHNEDDRRLIRHDSSPTERVRSRRRLVAITLVAALVPAAGVAGASPTVPLDDPIYLLLDRLALPPYSGGLRPLTEARVQELLTVAGQAPDPHLVADAYEGFWLAPLHGLRARAAIIDATDRPYSTPMRPRQLAGVVALACERQEGRPCGDGGGLELELDSAAGFGAAASIASRVRLDLRSTNGEAAASATLDRIHVGLELGPLAALVGRDVLVLGPSARTQAMWGTNAPPLDHVRLATARPIPILGENGSLLRMSSVVFLGRLADPQRFSGTLIDGTRIQFDLGDAFELGATHLIQLGGDGAPEVSGIEFLLEHVRHDSRPGGDFANHRFAIDLAVSSAVLGGLRGYYELAAEDLRREVGTVLLRDADHVLGLSVESLLPRIGCLVELTRTGVRSQEHDVFTTGMTSGGHVAGNPLGPDANAVFAELRIDGGPALIRPWIEVARLSSDRYYTPEGEIVRTEDLPEEWRLRAGVRAGLAITSELRVEPSGFAERVIDADFIVGRTRWNLGGEAVLAWRPAR